MDRVEIIKSRINEALEPTAVEVIDDSHLHAGHAGAQGGAGHYRAIITSPLFTGKNTLARHRLVFSLFADMMPNEIHALTLTCQTPEEVV